MHSWRHHFRFLDWKNENNSISFRCLRNWYDSSVSQCNNIDCRLAKSSTMDCQSRIGLALISIGAGGIKPCVNTFGGDQFKLPEQATQLATYFSLFYLTINVGSFISGLVTPVLRADVHCFGRNDCYSLAFGAPSVLMFVAIGEFLIVLFSQKNYTFYASQ